MRAHTKNVTTTSTLGDMSPRSGHRRIPWAAIGGGLALVALVAAWIVLPLETWLEQFRAWVQSQGARGAIVFGVVYIIATVAMAPAAPFTIAAGLAYGLWAFPLVIVSATLGACAAFLTGRHLARRCVAGMIERRPRLAAIDRAVAEEGWKIVALMRLSPVVPFNLQNYFFGVTRVGFVAYAVATFFAIMPGALLYIWIGSIGAAAAEGGGGPVQWTFFALGLLATIAVTVIVARRARRRLARAGLDEGSDGADDTASQAGS